MVCNGATRVHPRTFGESSFSALHKKISHGLEFKALNLTVLVGNG